MKRPRTLVLFALAAPFAVPAYAEDQSAEDIEVRERLRLIERAIDDLRGLSHTEATEIPLDLDARIRVYTAVDFLKAEELGVLQYQIEESMLQFTANLDRKMSVNTEFSFEPTEHEVVIGLEAMELQVNVTPGLSVSAGAFHNPLSTWAITASQGAYRYLPVFVPTILIEEEAHEYLSIDQTGAQIRFLQPAGFWQLGLLGAVTNGRSPDPGASSQAGDWENGKAVIGRASLQAPNGLLFTVGGSYDAMNVHDESIVVEPTGNAYNDALGRTIFQKVPEIVFAGNIVWQGGPVELDVEFYPVLHKVEGVTYTNFSGFAVVGVPIQKTTPYVMFDYLSIDEDDPIYAVYMTEPSRFDITTGFRQELGLHLALKGEVELDVPIGNNEFGWHAQTQLSAGF